MNHLARWVGVTVLLIYGAGSWGAPNVVVILADDLGYGDLAIQNPGSRLPTPHLDALARSGARFIDAHTPSSVCTPTRYGLLTGRYCWRTRLKKGVLYAPNDTPLIEADRFTIAKLFRGQGYYTACVGKWHLGIDWARDQAGDADFNAPFRYGPTDVGFDEFFGIAGSLDMIPYVFYDGRAPVGEVTSHQEPLKFPRFVRSGPKAEGFNPGEALDALTDRAVKIIGERAADPRPFFLYFPLTSPHKPVWPAERFVGTTGLGPYGDFVAQTDWTVGQVLKALDRSGIADDTVVVLTSDNGSFMYRRPPGIDHVDDPSIQGFTASHHQANGPYRGTKADIWEAGHRVPFLVRWPGKTPAGRVVDSTICLTDLLATFAEALGVAPPAGAAEDSYSFLPLLTADSDKFDRPPVVHHSHKGTFAIRDGGWKLVLGNGSGGREQPRGKAFGKPYQLYDLTVDPTESNDLAAEYPKVVQRLTDALHAIRNGVPRPGA